MAKRRRIHSSTRRDLERCFGPLPSDDSSVLKLWNDRLGIVCKPCWELHYCPYGPLVEELPAWRPTRASAEAHDKYLTECLETGLVGSPDDQMPLEDWRRQLF